MVDVNTLAKFLFENDVKHQFESGKWENKDGFVHLDYLLEAKMWLEIVPMPREIVDFINDKMKGVEVDL